ncbi:MAG: hypothetical protein ACXVBH_01840 [Flavisolibacter sp.]
MGNSKKADQLTNDTKATRRFSAPVRIVAKRGSNGSNERPYGEIASNRREKDQFRSKRRESTRHWEIDRIQEFCLELDLALF